MRLLSGFSALVLSTCLAVGVAHAAPATDLDDASGAEHSGSGVDLDDQGGEHTGGATGGTVGGTVGGTAGGTVGATGGTSGSTQSFFPTNPVFGNPDINYVMHNPGVSFKGGILTMTVDRTLGDHLQIDQGNGFRSMSARLVLTSGPLVEQNASPNLIQFGPGGTFTLVGVDAKGTNFLSGTITGIQLTPTMVGWNYALRFNATGGTLAAKYGTHGAMFGLFYNVRVGQGGILSGFTAQSKGDIAPLQNGSQVPEPATLALLTVGLGGLLTQARRRFVA